MPFNVTELLAENTRLKEQLKREREISHGRRLENQQLRKTVACLELRVTELESIIKEQASVINELKRQLGLNSTNSSKSPSDKEVTHKPSKCAGCGSELSDFDFTELRQVHDIVISKVVTNHMLYSGYAAVDAKRKLS